MVDLENIDVIFPDTSNLIDENQSTNLPAVTDQQRAELNKEANDLIGQMLVETDSNKTQEIVSLFNLNQKKKTMARMNKLNDLYDLITDQAISRFTRKPDEIDNGTLLQAMKIIQDNVERSQKQIVNQQDTPLIQINQQTNELTVGDKTEFSKESRDKIKGAVAKILAGIGTEIENTNNTVTIIDHEEDKENDE